MRYFTGPIPRVRGSFLYQLGLLVAASPAPNAISKNMN